MNRAQEHYDNAIEEWADLQDLQAREEKYKRLKIASPASSKQFGFSDRFIGRKVDMKRRHE